MDDDDSTTISIADDGSEELKLVLRPAGEDVVVSVSSTRRSRDPRELGLQVEFSTVCNDGDLASFAMELERFDDTEQAMLVNAMGDLSIEFRLLRPGKGVVEVNALLESSGRGVEGGSSVVLRGFTTDQSYLNGIAEDVRRFLRRNETGALP